MTRQNIKQICPFCKNEFESELTDEQQDFELQLDELMKKEGLKMPPHQDVWCKCGAHITLINNKIVSSSKRASLEKNEARADLIRKYENPKLE